MLRKLSFRSRTIAAFLLAASCLGALMFFQIRAADDGDSSFYSLASAAATYYDSSRKPSGDSDKFLEADVNAGNAGGLIGYVDKNITPGASIALRSDSSNNSQTVSIPNSLSNASSLLDEGVLGYMYYGQALKYFGLDTIGKQTGIMAFLYQTLASLTFIFYYLSSAMQMLFGFVLNFLRLLNPFRFLGFMGQSSVDVPDMSTAVWDSAAQKWVASSHAASWDTSVNSGLAGGAAGSGWISDLTSTLSGWYTTLSEMSWQIAIPLFTVLLFASFVFYERTDHFKSNLKKYAIRIFFLVAGIPILGSLYTGILNSVTYSTGMTNGSQAAAYQIATTYLDFETWCKTTNLNLPAGAQIVVTNDENQSPSFALKNMSLANVAWSASNMKSPFVEYGDQDWNSMGSGMYEADVHHVTSILSRYIMHNSFSAADYEFYFKTSVAGNNPDLYNEIEKYSDPFELEKDGESQGRAFTDRQNDPAGILTNGSLTASMSNTGTSPVMTLERGDTSGYGLSTLAMYNFLNTDFSSSGATVYSSRNTSNNRISMARNSVTIVGRSGPERFVNALRTLLMIAAFVVVQFLFIFQLVVRNTITGFKMIFSTPGALLGSIHSIGMVIAYVVIMIVQILVAAFIMEMSGVLMSMISRIDLLDFLQQSTSSGLMNTAGQAVGALISGILSCLIYLVFIVFILRFSVSITTGISTAIIKVVDQLLAVPAPHNYSLAREAFGSIEGSMQTIRSAPSSVSSMQSRFTSGRTEKAGPYNGYGGGDGPNNGNGTLSVSPPGGTGSGGPSVPGVPAAAQEEKHGNSAGQNGNGSEVNNVSDASSMAETAGPDSAASGAEVQGSQAAAENSGSAQSRNVRSSMTGEIENSSRQSVNSHVSSSTASTGQKPADRTVSSLAGNTAQENRTGSTMSYGESGQPGQASLQSHTGGSDTASASMTRTSGFSLRNAGVDRISPENDIYGSSEAKTSRFRQSAYMDGKAGNGPGAANMDQPRTASGNTSVQNRPDKTGDPYSHQTDGTMQTSSGIRQRERNYGGPKNPHANSAADADFGLPQMQNSGHTRSKQAGGAPLQSASAQRSSVHGNANRTQSSSAATVSKTERMQNAGSRQTHALSQSSSRQGYSGYGNRAENSVLPAGSAIRQNGRSGHSSRASSQEFASFLSAGSEASSYKNGIQNGRQQTGTFAAESGTGTVRHREGSMTMPSRTASSVENAKGISGFSNQSYVTREGTQSHEPRNISQTGSRKYGVNENRHPSRTLHNTGSAAGKEHDLRNTNAKTAAIREADRPGGSIQNQGGRLRVDFNDYGANLNHENRDDNTDGRAV